MLQQSAVLLDCGASVSRNRGTCFDTVTGQVILGTGVDCPHATVLD